MKSLWKQSDLDALIADCKSRGINEDLAIRTYSSRILGQEPALVLHGGGNTSVKTRIADVLGSETDVLCVKGSGWDMATIEPAGHPAVELAPLAAIARREIMSDDDLVAAQRRLLLDPYAPNPSIEAVLHAIIPHKFVDHTHANSILSLTNQPDGEAIIQDLFPETTIVPYIMPGFVLAKECRRILDIYPNAKSMILMKHGIFTFHDDPRQSYEDMISMVSQAETRLEEGKPRPFHAINLPEKLPSLEEVAPIVRGALARETEIEGRPDRWVLDFRTNDEIRHFVDGERLSSYGKRGNASPDHSIRIKRFGMVAPAPCAKDLESFRVDLDAAVADFITEYEAYFRRNNTRLGGGLRMLDPIPRVVYVPGLGLFGVGKTEKEAKIAADVAEATVNVITRAESVGSFSALSEEDLFDIEYWSLEQAKLAKITEKPLNRQIAIVTGGASGIGFATAKALKAEGAEVAIFDINAEALNEAAKSLGALAVICDVTCAASVEVGVAKVIAAYGGVDILISNAGAAVQGSLIEVEEALFHKAFDLNFWSHQLMSRACVKVMEAQGSGGAIVYNVSKQAVNQGQDFGPYGTSKAALMALMRQYALEHGKSGITSNAVNPDRIRTNLLTDDFVRERAGARGVTPAEYMRGNLLKREVVAADVAAAFVHLVKATKTSGAVLTVDGGNVAAMVR